MNKLFSLLYADDTIILSETEADMQYAGADPGFLVRGGALKKIAPSGGRRENFWDISCEKSRFYAKKSYFSFSSPKSEYFFQQHWESEYFFRKKT
jgi:hypothetical protein